MDDGLIERVRHSINIVEFIGGHIRLQKRGRNHVALCPFHQEKTPSFSVNEDRQIFKCFGCGAGGDVFAFVQRIEGLSFPEAVRFLAERYGIPLPAGRGETDRSGEDRSRLFEVMRSADAFFRRQLTAESPAAGYLRERGIDEATIRAFGIGFAPAGNQLFAFLRGEGVGASEIETCGLANRSAGGEYYDRFRSRVIFPIQNLSQRTIAFGGRILGEGQPKYLNSPETPLYSKGNHLYGLSLGRDSIRQKGFAVLVEGYFDCVVPFQHGIQNVVASLGTSLTEGQVKVLGRYTRRVVVSYDPDSAGESAAMRSIDLFQEQGFAVNVLTLPSGEDPDSYIFRHGVEAYLLALKKSAPFLDFLMDRFISQQRDPWSPKGKREITDQIVPYLARIPNRVERAEYVSRIAFRLRVDEHLLMEELRKRTRRPVGIRSGGGEVPARASLTATPAEATLLAAVLDPQFRSFALPALEDDLFEGLSAQGIFERILELKNQKREISVFSLRGLLEGEALDLFDRVTVNPVPVPLSEEAVVRSIEAIREIQIGRLSRLVQEEIVRCEREGGNPALLNELLRRKEALQRQRRR